MRTQTFPRLFILPAVTGLLLAARPAGAKPSPLHYEFSPGTTNVYSVEVTVQEEQGQEVISGLVFISVSEVSSNQAVLDWHDSLRTENKHSPGGGYFGGHYVRPMGGFPRQARATLDDHGHMLRDASDYALPMGLGELIPAIFPPLPAKISSTESVTDEAVVVDAPQLLGPVQSAGASQSFNPGYIAFDPRQSPAMLAVNRRADWKMVSNTPEKIVLDKQTHLRSFLRVGEDPRLDSSTEETLEFAPDSGRFDSITGSGRFSSTTETSSSKSTMRFSFKRLTGAALASALTPPVPVAPVHLTAEEMQKFADGLKSDDADTRRQALMRLHGASLESPSADLLDLLANLAVSDGDMFTRMTSMTLLAGHATTNQLPQLIKALRTSDFGIRQNATKELGRLRDPRAIEPLVALVARGGSFDQDAPTALISIGAAAEKPVLALLDEHATETRRQACDILKQIGTKDSVEALQKQTTDPDQNLSQAAVEAVRAINERL